jgi:hypothetical protein
MGATYIRTFLPLKTEPTQIFHGGLGVFFFTAKRIDVLDPQDNIPIDGMGALFGTQKCGSMSEMQQPGGSGGNATTICHQA